LIVAGAAAYVYEFAPGTLNTSTQVSWTAGVTGVLSNTSAGITAGVYDYRGDLNLVPLRGTLWVSPKKVGFPAATGYVSRLIMNHPQGLPTPGNTLYLTPGSATAISGVAVGFGGSLSTNGVRIFGSWTQVGNTDNRVYVAVGMNNIAYTSAGLPGAGKLVLKG
jgi:hypothetical protein